MSDFKDATKCIQSGYVAGNGELRTLPIYQGTTYRYDSSEHLAKLFDLEAPGHMYTRISNPTVAFVEEKIADLEGGIGAMCTSSGQAASMVSVFNICSAGQNFVCLNNLYGGTTNLFSVTLKRMGIEVRYVSEQMSDEEISSFFDENTRLVFAETLANPSLAVLDFERFSSIAHSHGVPLIVDNTFATPILCRPFEHGADIIIHSTTKYMDGHATVVGGVVIDSGKFDWAKDGKYPELSEPDPSYHGISYTEQFKEAAYIIKARVQLMRDLGITPQPTAAFYLNLGLETLALRIRQHSHNALRVAQFLKDHEKVSWVNYPGLADDEYHERSQRYFTDGLSSGVVAFGVAGGREAAGRFMDSLKLTGIVVHVADARTSVLHPASTTHRQLSDEQLKGAGISADFVRLSIGIEDADDILADISQALDQA
ncbi:MAG: O-acetylhomoserine aminocarboxypropyltransferase/cysteine synthase [Sphaerochaetaceae bacterium]|nr:O-acetylhomoserine aminocarboxypropyltransferase/cysteine synthase [Sphaerochaetaceae bacterium]